MKSLSRGRQAREIVSTPVALTGASDQKRQNLTLDRVLQDPIPQAPSAPASHGRSEGTLPPLARSRPRRLRLHPRRPNSAPEGTSTPPASWGTPGINDLTEATGLRGSPHAPTAGRRPLRGCAAFAGERGSARRDPGSRGRSVRPNLHDEASRPLLRTCGTALQRPSGCQPRRSH